MNVEIINRTRQKIPQKFIKNWTQTVCKKLKKKKVLKVPKDIVIVFVTAAQIKKLNAQYRNKNKPTDILSFEALDPDSLGELVLCLPVLKKQAKEHKLSLNEEIGYMIIHGILHLLGFDHEQGAAKARKMFRLQDEIFRYLVAFPNYKS